MLAREIGFIFFIFIFLFFLHFSVKQEKASNRENSQKVEFVYRETFPLKQLIYYFSYMKAPYQCLVLYYVYIGAKVNHIGAMSMVITLTIQGK